MTPTPAPTDVATIAANLTKAQRDILERLANGQKLGLASRADDRARQSLRKQGYIAYCGSPLRWQISASGVSLYGHLTGADHG